MNNFKSIMSFTLVFLLLVSCSLTEKLKEKLNSEKKDTDTKEETVKEETKEVTSGDDLNFYNKYIDVSNKIQESGDKVYRDYVSDIPEPKSLTKGSFIIAVSLSLSVSNLERTIKDYKRSYYDGGELSKLSAASEMKNEIEGELVKLLKVLEDYHGTASKVSDYYSKGEFKKDLSKTVPYDEEMKSDYEKYKSAFDKFAAAIKKYKPKREIRDPNTISNPDEKSIAILMNAYESTLDAAEEFYDNFNAVEFKGDLSASKKSFEEFEKTYKEDKNTVLSAEFTDKTKYMKYSYEDYFAKMTGNFLDAGKKFFDEAPNANNVNEFNRLYDDVVNNYNYMITAYNTNINVVNTFKVW
ncbi:MAG: YiiG family protein [Chlorobi bacterium]|nr:YiiG family protein [Chlorobiota bacterium]MCI0716632.1 YiiG family protein [Chlorobiota bacterium]